MRSNPFLSAMVLVTLLLWGACTKTPLERDLINASGLGNTQEVQRLLSLGVNVNCRDSTLNAWTPLIWAIHNGQGQVVPVLLAGGADPNIKDGTGKTALFYVLRRTNQAPTITALILAGASTTELLMEVQQLDHNNPSRVAFEEAIKLRSK